MKIVIPALAAAFIATVGAASSAQAAVINFAVDVSGPTITYTGPRLNSSTALDLDATPLSVTSIGTGDDSGLALGNFISISPSDIMYGTGTLAAEIVKSWTGLVGGVSDSFIETLTTVDSINRTTRNAITVDLTGTVTDSLGIFKSTPAEMLIAATQVGGPGRSVSASLTNFASTVPEPSTWVMLALGFAGLGYAAVRRSAKDKAALAI